jgi:carboxyl-terminal processing protease
MRAPALVAFLLALLPLLAPGATRAERFGAGRPLDQQLMADVFNVAFRFMSPRTLEAVPLADLSLWALRGLTTLDGRLQADFSGGSLRLLAPGRVLLARSPPAEGDAAGWADVVAQFARAGWDASEAVRRAGMPALIRTLFDELFNHFDPYSRYAPPAEAQAARLRRAGQGGIGVQIGVRGGGFVAQSVAQDGPGAQAGIRPGDRLLAIDGQSVQDEDIESVVAALAGPDGTEVGIALRGRDGKLREMRLVRALVPPQSVSSERAADVLIVHISGFTSDTGARLAQALLAGLAGPRTLRGVVIDLRGNRGGFLRQAVAAAEALLPFGVVTFTVGRDPAASHVFVANGRDLSGGLPLVVIVDGRSASAAEILAAGLADQHRAVVVGSATLGKGLVQTIAPLPDGGELLISWSRVLAPLGWPIQGLGVLPQVCTSLGENWLRRQLAGLAQGRQALARPLERHRAVRAPMPPAEMLEIRGYCPAAEGRDLDLVAATRLLHDPAAYAAALLGPPLNEPIGIDTRHRDPASEPRHLTATPPMRN